MSQKQTIYVEPSTHNNSRTEFDIPNYQGRNYRLVGMGLTNYVMSGGGLARYFPSACGALVLMDTITLYNGTELLGQLRNVPQWAGYNLLCDNPAYNYSINSIQYQTLISYDPLYKIVMDNVGQYILGNNYNTAYVDLYRLLPFFLGLDLSSYTEMVKAVKGNDRKKVKQLIKKSSNIRGDVLNLRLVIEYSSNTPNLLFGNGNIADTYTIKKPSLVFDKMLTDLDTSRSFNMVYDSYDMESVLRIAEAVNTDVNEDYPLYGCSNKFCSEVTIISAPNISDTIAVGFPTKSFCSTGLWKENLNIIVNDLPIIPSNILSTPARKQMFLNYSKPNFTTPILGNIFYHSADPNNQLFGAETSFAAQCQGLYSYITLSINQKVSIMRLQRNFKAFDYGVHFPAQLGALNTLIYYTTRRILTYKDGQIMVTSV